MSIALLFEMTYGVPFLRQSTDEDGKRIDYVGQRYHPQPQDPIPNWRAAPRKPNIPPIVPDDDSQFVQAQQSIKPFKKTNYDEDDNDDALQNVQKPEPITF